MSFWGDGSWQPGSNGRNKMHWFLYRDGRSDEREYHEDSRGYLIRYASFETAQRAADKLNAAEVAS